MAAEARAMLDALMGSDRNAVIPKTGGNGTFQKTKKSCYDHDICPLYCAWGIDVYELFTNTKSDLGPNPLTVRDDAREEWMGLPDHEKDRLGYEMQLHRKLGDLVRNCDRIVNRNKEKLRVEIAKAAKARGAAGRTIDPATDVDEGMLAEAAELMADLELREEEVGGMLQTLMDLDGEWKGHWDELKCLENGKSTAAQDPDPDADANRGSAGNENAGADVSKNAEGGKEGTSEAEAATDDNAPPKEKKNDTETDGENEGEKNNNASKDKTEEDTQNSSETQTQKQEESVKIDVEEKIKALKSKLYKISAQQQKLISSLSILTTQTIVPLRDNLQNITKQLHYVKTDTSSDKTVCEVSGNFMSSRDAEERIAAHYAGKQYVGWKMVRDKFRELNKKYSHGNGRQMGGGGGFYGGGGGGPRGGGYGGRGGGGGYGYNNGHGRGQGYGHGNNRHPMGHGPPGYGGPPQPQYGRHNDRDRRRERSRSRDRDRDGPSSSRSRHHRRRSPSPPRWKRDRGYGGRR